MAGHNNTSMFTVETVGITPEVPAAEGVGDIGNHRLRIDDDDVV